MEHTKRKRISDITKGSLTFDPEVMKKRFEEIQKEEEAALEKYEVDLKEESNRVKDLTCPVCKSTDKFRNHQYSSNGIIGPGHTSTTIVDHYICKCCGVHFSDINKKEIKKPNKLFR